MSDGGRGGVVREMVRERGNAQDQGDRHSDIDR
jgi:hypothetical protein